MAELDKAFNGNIDFQIMNKIINGEIPQLTHQFLNSLLQK
jgi:hypothetical protein